MSIFVVLLLLAILALVTVGLACVWLQEENNKHIFGFSLGAGMATLMVAGWLIASMFLPARVREQFLLVPTTVTGPDGMSVQVVAYPSEFGGVNVVNLTALYGKNLPPTKRVQVSRFEKGGYYGIWYNAAGSMPERMDIVDEK